MSHARHNLNCQEPEICDSKAPLDGRSSREIDHLHPFLSPSPSGFASLAEGGSATSSECPSAAETADGLLSVDQVPEGTDVVACDLVGLRILVGQHAEEALESGDLPPWIEIPPPGEGVELNAYGQDEGSEASIFVGVPESGMLTYDEAGPGAGLGPDPCEDSGYQLLTYPMNSQETFNIKTSSFPSYVNQTSTRDAILAGIRAWPQQFNDCGMSDLADATAVDGGGTTAGSAAGAGGCSQTNHDDVSVASFGAAPAGVVAFVCRHIKYQAIGNIVDGADMRLSDAYLWTNQPDSPDCVEIDIQSIVTHEAGHVWGLADLNPNSHPRLTMRGSGVDAVTCRAMLRTLGKGDVLGMRQFY